MDKNNKILFLMSLNETEPPDIFTEKAAPSAQIF